MPHLHFKAIQIISHTPGFLKISVGIQISLKIPVLKAMQRYLIISSLLHVHNSWDHWCASTIRTSLVSLSREKPDCRRVEFAVSRHFITCSATRDLATLFSTLQVFQGVPGTFQFVQSATLKKKKKEKGRLFHSIPFYVKFTVKGLSFDTHTVWKYLLKCSILLI